jgi:CubicO group peptidase (beta-lactamase class C family)
MVSKSNIFSFLILFQAFCLLSQDVAPDTEIKIEIEKIIRFDSDISFKKTPGFIVSIIDNDNTYHIPFGYKQKKTKDILSEADIFELGSVTKVCTAALFYKWIDADLITGQENVNSFLEEPWQNPRLDHLTIDDLLHHVSGFSKLPSFFGKKQKDVESPYSYYQKDDLLNYYRDFIPDSVKLFQYSHTNYALLEIIAEKISGLPFNDVMQNQIFEPAGMQNTFIDFPETEKLSPGYDRSGKATQSWRFASFKGSEALKSTAADLVKFIQDFHFKMDHKVNRLPGLNAHLQIDRGWHLVNMGAFDIYTHTGQTSGHNVFVAFIKETKTAVIILANSSIGTEDLGFQILRMINHNWKRIKV